MALDGKILRRALDRYEEANRLRSENARRLREEIYSKDARVEELDRLLRSSVAEAAALALRHGGDPERAVKAIQEKNLSWQDERAGRIAALGYPKGCIDEEPACPLCSDRGYVGTKPCTCLMKIYKEEQRKELSRLLNLRGENFDAFQLRYYDAFDPVTGSSPRRHMEMVLLNCRSYAENFRPDGRSLFLTGAPGLGKTFLSACIASVVAEKGFSVVYDTAVNVVSCFEEARFGRRGEPEEAQADVQRCLRCDLLILDDLGTEMNTSFSVSAIYEVLNTRLREGRSTVVSSNLSLEEISRRYTSQIASRLAGSYKELKFYGKDIRIQKKEEN
ncbi:MAG: ATP-binding protein [Oscillospiraceae bacterium]|nr:ATP-binding protein [Oscillospiraceae bacterium]